MMALKTIKFKRDDLEFSYKVTINTDGIFTTYLPENIVATMEAAGVNMRLNPQRKTRTGFFSDTTLAGLKAQVNEAIEEYFSREVVEDKIVIRYDIQTTCAYCLDINGKVVPNGYEEWTLSDKYAWQTGTVEQDGSYPKPYGILVYAKVFRKQVFAYRSGKTKTEYELVNTNNLNQGSFAYHLASFSSMSPPGGDYKPKLQEIDYTESTARFFVELLTSICRLNEKIKDKLDPKSILNLIETRQKLLE